MELFSKNLHDKVLREKDRSLLNHHEEGRYLLQYHSAELKTRLFYVSLSLISSFILCFTQIEYLLYKLTSIILDGLNKNLSQESISSITGLIEEGSASPSASLSTGFIFTELLEGFWSTLLLSGYAAFILSLPVIYYNGYKFLLPGLTYLEARFLKTFLILSLVFLIFAHLLTYLLIIPYAASFFLSFQSNYPQTGFISFTGRIYPALSFLLNCFSVITFLFQLPLFLFFLFLYFDFNQLTVKLSSIETKSLSLTEGLSSTFPPSEAKGDAESLSSSKQFFFRKILFFALVLFTAILSPPDLYSQLFLFLPLFFILESFIFMILVFKESPYSRSKDSRKTSSKQENLEH